MALSAVLNRNIVPICFVKLMKTENFLHLCAVSIKKYYILIIGQMCRLGWCWSCFYLPGFGVFQPAHKC